MENFLQELTPMSGNEIAKKATGFKNSCKRLFAHEGFRNVCTQAAAAICGFLFTKSMVFGRFAPFSIALASAVPNGSLFFSLAGSALGYMLSGDLAIPARYVAAIMAVAILRFALKDYHTVSRHPAYVPLIAFLSCFSTGLTVILVSNTMRGAAVLYFAEALLCSAAAWFFERSLSHLFAKDKKRPQLSTLLSSGPLLYSCLFFLLCLMLSLKDAVFFGLSLMRIFSGLLILLAARFGTEGAGAVAGIGVSIMQNLSTVGLSTLPGAFAASGFFSGLFRKGGNLLTGLIYIFSMGIFSLQSAYGELSATAICESLFSVALFLAIAPKLGAAIKRAEKESSPRFLLLDKLRHIASAIRDVPAQIQHISKNLTRQEPPRGSAFIQAVDHVCKTCRMRDICWGVHYSRSFDSIIGMSGFLEQNGMVTDRDIKKMFDGACCQEREFAQSVNQHYQNDTMQNAAQERAREIQQLLSDQFITVSDILEDAASGAVREETVEREAPLYTLSVGIAQHVYGEGHTHSSGRPCGDGFTWFELEDGRMAAVLSDGMGTGGRAAVDSALCTGTIRELIRAGLSPQASVKIAGHAIMANAGDESFATADIALFDPSDGFLSLFKAGACPTILIKNGEALLSELRSLPIGILGDIQVQTDKTRLRAGDVAVMLTDGALAVDAELLCDTLLSCFHQKPQEIAEKLVQTVLTNRGENRDDDISIAVLSVENAKNS